MATSATFQAELNGLLMGRSTVYSIVDYATSTDIVSHDLARLMAPGEYQGPQYSGALYVDLTLNVSGTSEANLYSNLATLSAAWEPSLVDVTFEFNLPSTGAQTCTGRPYRFDVPSISGDMRISLLITGIRAQFKAGTPTWT